jgi:hypothetical protein
MINLTAGLLYPVMLGLWVIDPSAATATQEPLDTLVNVGQHRLHLVLYRGKVPMTILFEAGGQPTWRKPLVSWRRAAESGKAARVHFLRARTTSTRATIDATAPSGAIPLAMM